MNTSTKRLRYVEDVYEMYTKTLFFKKKNKKLYKQPILSNIMFGLFRKKGDHQKETHRKIEHLHNSVSGSFKNIKRDMDSINKWLEHLKELDDKKNKRLELMEKQILALSKKLESHSSILSEHAASIEAVNLARAENNFENLENNYYEYEYDEPEEQVEEPRFIIPKHASQVNIKSMLRSLTDTQKMMFIKLYSLQRESGGSVPFKALAEEIYPGKEYGDVRSTISEYLTLLSEWGLVSKKRTGKQSFVSVTPKGEELIDQLTRESKKANKMAIKRRHRH